MLRGLRAGMLGGERRPGPGQPVIVRCVNGGVARSGEVVRDAPRAVPSGDPGRFVAWFEAGEGSKWRRNEAMAMNDTMLALTVAAALVLAVLATSSFRLVPADERLVRFRRGRRGHRVKGPGLVVVVPGIDRGVRVPLRKTWADVMWLDATTRDGVPVTVSAAALVSARDPGRYALTAESADSATNDALEAEIDRYVAERDLVELSGWVTDQYDELTSRVNARTDEWGVQVARVELSRIEVRLGAELIRWAEDLSARTPRAARQLRRSA